MHSSVDSSKGISIISSVSPRETIQAEVTKSGSLSQTNPGIGIIPTQSINSAPHIDFSAKILVKTNTLDESPTKNQAIISRAEALLKKIKMDLALNTFHKQETKTPRDYPLETEHTAYNIPKEKVNEKDSEQQSDFEISTEKQEEITTHQKKDKQNYSNLSDDDENTPRKTRDKKQRASWTSGEWKRRITQQSLPGDDSIRPCDDSISSIKPFSKSHPDLLLDLNLKPIQTKDESIETTPRQPDSDTLKEKQKGHPASHYYSLSSYRDLKKKRGSLLDTDKADTDKKDKKPLSNDIASGHTRNFSLTEEKSHQNLATNLFVSHVDSTHVPTPSKKYLTFLKSQSIEQIANKKKDAINSPHQSPEIAHSLTSKKSDFDPTQTNRTLKTDVSFKAVKYSASNRETPDSPPKKVKEPQEESFNRSLKKNKTRILLDTDKDDKNPSSDLEITPKRNSSPPQTELKHSKQFSLSFTDSMDTLRPRSKSHLNRTSLLQNTLDEKTPCNSFKNSEEAGNVSQQYQPTNSGIDNENLNPPESELNEIEMIQYELSEIEAKICQVIMNPQGVYGTLVKKIKELNTLYTHTIQLKDTLTQHHHPNIPIEINTRISYLIKEINTLGSDYSTKYFKPISQIIQNSSHECYTFGFVNELTDLLVEFPDTLFWIESYNPACLNQIHHLFKTSLSQTLQFIINKFDNENDKRQQTVQLLLEARSSYQFLAQQDSSSGKSWADYQSDILNQLKSHWFQQKKKIREEIEEEDLIDIISVQHFLDKISEEKRDKSLQTLLDKNSEEKRDKESHELANSFSSTIFNLRIKSLANLESLSSDETSLEQLSSAKYASQLLKETIDLSEDLSRFVVHSIVSKKGISQRAHLIEVFSMCIQKCLELGDLESAAALARGIANQSISRLHKTFDTLKASTQMNIETFCKFVSPEHNFIDYRTYADHHPHVIPCLAVLLKDREATFAGNKEASLKKWKKKIEEEFLRITFHSQLHRLHQKTLGNNIFSIQDLESYLHEQRYRISPDSEAVFQRARHLENLEKNKT